jgi:hypothetical protein
MTSSEAIQILEAVEGILRTACSFDWLSDSQRVQIRGRVAVQRSRIAEVMVVLNAMDRDLDSSRG